MVLLYFPALVTIEGVIQRAIEGLTQDQDKRRVNMFVCFLSNNAKKSFFQLPYGPLYFRAYLNFFEALWDIKVHL